MSNGIKSPLSIFFGLGEKVTRGDPERQADFIYYMVWILFIAFAVMFLSNGYRLIVYQDIDYAVWTLVGFAICGIQYFSLKGMYDMRKMRNKPVKATPDLGSVDDMMKSFEREVDNNVRKESKS